MTTLIVLITPNICLTDFIEADIISRKQSDDTSMTINRHSFSNLLKNMTEMDDAR